MKLRKPNNTWSKEIENIYYNYFLKDINSGKFKVLNKFFSNIDLLDCLENDNSGLDSQIKLIKKLIKNKIPKSILVIGTGSGRLANEISILFPYSKIFEIDKNPIVIKRLKNKYKSSNFRFSILANASNLPFPNNYIDLVISYSVFRYIKNINQTLLEIMRVVKDNGLIIISEAKNNNPINKIREFLQKKNIFFKTIIFPTVRLKHLTFFYYLLNKYKKNKVIKKLIDLEAKEKNINKLKAAFNLAGSSLGSIYTILWQKKL
jgi:ubiquinone/menaquinone biosynthesis C-methylase UbiE